MARLDMAVDHGQTPEVARANFEQAIAAAQARYGKWLRRMDWSPDRTAVTVAGTGFDVEISYDERKVYARGTIPMAFKILEAPIKVFVARALNHLG
ncbi:MAG: hypothetical protein ACLQGP_21140 [Isosphaeraceae bacterium]